MTRRLGFTVAELLPHARGGGRLRIGLSWVAEADWLQPVFDRAARARAFDAHPDAIRLLPQAEAPARELAAMLRADSFAAAARGVWEDLCLLLPDAGGPYRLAGAAVAFPTDWRLDDKIGRTVDAIHAPIHGYAEDVAQSVDRFLSALEPGAIYGRANWFVVPTDAQRYLPADPPEHRFAGVDGANAGERLFVRCERQTLRRLPETGAILFTIGIAIARLDALDAPLVRRLADAVATLAPGEDERRAAPAYAAALRDYAAGPDRRREAA